MREYYELNDVQKLYVPVMPVGPVLPINTMFNDILYDLTIVGPTDPVDPV